jgi:hypothetical protein
MPIFLLISRHSPENCPILNARTRKVYVEYLTKLDGLMKKHGIKNLGAVNVYTEHLTVMISEAPSLDAFQKLSMEPEILALSATETYEVKIAMGMEEVTRMLKKAP